MAIKLLRREKAQEYCGLSNTEFYRRIKSGLLPVGIPSGKAIRVWPDYEIEKIQKAIIAGASDEEIRIVVSNIHKERGAACGRT